MIAELDLRLAPDLLPSAPHSFELDQVHCATMESLLQALKFRRPHIQERICGASAAAARTQWRTRNVMWKSTKSVWWREQTLLREGPDYQLLLDRAFQAMFDQNETFRRALAATGATRLCNTILKTAPRETVLTADELCARLTILRAGLRLETVTAGRCPTHHESHPS